MNAEEKISPKDLAARILEYQIDPGDPDAFDAAWYACTQFIDTAIKQAEQAAFEEGRKEGLKKDHDIAEKEPTHER